MSNLNEQDLQAKETVRQARPGFMGSRLSGVAAAGVAGSIPPAPTSTLVDDSGNVRRLFILDYNTLDDPNTYLGDAPVTDS